MNRRAKGNRNELRAKKMLEEAGFAVAKKVHTRYSPGDFFGLFDLIAIGPDGVHLIQVKTGRNACVADRKRIKAFAVPCLVSREVWVYRDREEFPMIHVL